MTLVHVRLTIPVGQVGGPEAPAAGLMVWTPHTRLVAEDRVVLREGFEKELLPGITTVEVRPGAWHVREPGQKPESRWVIVPDVPEVDYEELVSIHPGTLAPLANPEAAWWAAVGQLEATPEMAAAAAENAAEAALSASSAAQSAGAADTSAASASSSASNAAASANDADAARSGAVGAAGDADAARTSAQGAAGSAAASADAASDSAAQSAQSAGEAQESATDAATSVTAASDHATAAAASAGAAQAARTGAEDARTGAQAAQNASEAARDDINALTLSADVTTSAPGTQASVDVTGSLPNLSLELTIPRGDVGPANTLSIGTVTTGAPGSNASAEITGAAPDQSLDLTIPRGGAGEPTAFELRGDGMPNGVVAAPPGTYYTDRLGTNGAWRWLKKSGTGSTGWDCIVGDTGWRNVTSLAGSEFAVVNPNDYGYCLRRVDGNVQINIKAQTVASTWGGFRSVPIPAGFRVSATTFPAVMVEAMQTAGAGRGQIQADHKLTLLSATWATSGVRITFNLVTTTPDPWPTTLPGVPA